MTATEPAISVVPANEASWEDLQTVFGTRGEASRCQCQRYKMRPRESFAYGGLLRNNRVPWAGRAQDKTDDSVWAVTCLFTRAGFRKRGVSRALARAAVDFARRRGSRAIEGYPMTTKNVISEELHVGTEGVFADAGFTEVSRPTRRRVVMRFDF